MSRIAGGGSHDCIGWSVTGLWVQEEQKVAILRSRLEEMNIDVDSLLQAVGESEDVTSG